MNKFNKYDPDCSDNNYRKGMSKRSYYSNIIYPSYMAKISTMTYLIEDFEKDYCYVDATYIFSGMVNK